MADSPDVDIPEYRESGPEVARLKAAGSRIEQP
jgi:hypothetical protein